MERRNYLNVQDSASSSTILIRHLIKVKKDQLLQSFLCVTDRSFVSKLLVYLIINLEIKDN